MAVMKSVSFRRAEHLHRLLRESLYERVSRTELSRLIKKHVGAEQRTIRKYIGLLLEWGFIAETGVPGVYEVCRVTGESLQRVLMSASRVGVGEEGEEEPP